MAEKKKAYGVLEALGLLGTKATAAGGGGTGGGGVGGPPWQRAQLLKALSSSSNVRIGTASTSQASRYVLCVAVGSYKF